MTTETYLLTVAAQAHSLLRLLGWVMVFAFGAVTLFAHAVYTAKVNENDEKGRDVALKVGRYARRMAGFGIVFLALSALLPHQRYVDAMLNVEGVRPEDRARYLVEEVR